jgi:hypothetical protein
MVVVKLRGEEQREERSGGGFKSITDVARRIPEGAARKRLSADRDRVETR